MSAQRVGAVYLLALAVLTAVLVLTGGHAERSHGRRCSAPGAVVLTGRKVSAIDLSERHLRCADLERATIDGPVASTDLGGANLHAANLVEVELSDVNLAGADLSNSVLRDAELTDTSLGGANLRDADLRNATLTRSDLRRANLRGAVLRDATFTRADLRDADLRDADLHAATVTASDLRGANLKGANLDGVTYVDVLCPSKRKSANGHC